MTSAKITSNEDRSRRLSIMEGIFNEKTWNVFQGKLAAYKGSLTSFCKENSISKAQFYYYKKRFSKPSTTAFHAIAVANEEAAIEVTNECFNNPIEIKVEIGNAIIHIPIGETEILSVLIKALINHA